MAERSRSPFIALGGLSLALVALVLHALRYLPFIADDALISLRYAQRLLAGQGLTWTVGERVEGYSNLLWVLAVAGLGRLGVDLIAAARILGFLGMGAAIAAVIYAHLPTTLRAAVPVLLAVLYLPLSGPVAVWSIGGLEQPFVAAWLGWAVVLTYPLLDRPTVSWASMQAPGICLALLCVTRPDGVLFVAGTMFAILVIHGLRREGLRRAIGLAALPLLFTLAQLAFRLSYYESWVPNTALVKFAPSISHTWVGLRYLGAGAASLLPLIVLAAGSVFLSFRRKSGRARMTLLCLLTAVWVAYVAVVGGDIFPAWRHFVPLLVLLVLMVAEGARWVGGLVGTQSYATARTGGALLLGLFFFLQWNDQGNARAVFERWEWDGRVIGRLFKKAFGARQPLLAVDAAGALPYWSELPALDMLGLNDGYIPRHPPARPQRTNLGHDLGDGKYVLKRAPDLVVFGLATGGAGALFRSGREMQADPSFARHYTLVVFEGIEHGRSVRAQVWVRRQSERIGIRRSGGQIIVPGFLLNDGPESAARLGKKGALILPISAAQPGRLNRFELPPGRWGIKAEPSGALLRVRMRSRLMRPGGTPEGADRVVLDAPLPATLDPVDTALGRAVSLEVLPLGEGEVELEQLVLTRLGEGALAAKTKGRARSGSPIRCLPAVSRLQRASAKYSWLSALSTARVGLEVARLRQARGAVNRQLSATQARPTALVARTGGPPSRGRSRPPRCAPAPDRSGARSARRRSRRESRTGSSPGRPARPPHRGR